MPYKDTLADIDYALSRDGAFSYRCNACCRCCHNKVIRVGAYEILRLARRLGITTTQFIEQHTEAWTKHVRTGLDGDGVARFHHLATFPRPTWSCTAMPSGASLRAPDQSH